MIQLYLNIIIISTASCFQKILLASALANVQHAKLNSFALLFCRRAYFDYLFAMFILKCDPFGMSGDLILFDRIHPISRKFGQTL